MKHFKWREDTRQGNKAQISYESAQHSHAITYMQDPTQQSESQPTNVGYTLTEHIPVTHVQEATVICPTAVVVSPPVELNKKQSTDTCSSSADLRILSKKNKDGAYNDMASAEPNEISQETSQLGQSILPSPTYTKLNNRSRSQGTTRQLHTKSKKHGREGCREEPDAVCSTSTMRGHVAPPVKIGTKYVKTADKDVVAEDIRDTAEVKIVDDVRVHDGFHGEDAADVQDFDVMSHAHDAHICEVPLEARHIGASCLHVGSTIITDGAARRNANDIGPSSGIQSSLSSIDNKHIETKSGARELSAACSSDSIRGQVGLSAEMRGTLYQSTGGILSQNSSGDSMSSRRLLDETEVRRPTVAHAWLGHGSKLGEESGDHCAMDGKHSFVGAETDCSALPAAVVRPWQMFVSLTRNMFRLPANVNASPA